MWDQNEIYDVDTFVSYKKDNNPITLQKKYLKEETLSS